jgi:aspartyl-tRNA(Asn)/glutamyl-tRNA(Gln) amidotransferase subunit A
MALCWTLDKLGPLCLTADDCGLVLEAIAGFDPNDPTTIDEDWKYKPKMKKRFRLAVPRGVVDGAEEDVRDCFEKALNILRKLSIIEEFEFPELPYEAMTRTILNAEAASAFDEFTESGEASKLTAPEDRYGLYARTVVFAKDYLKALRLRRVVARVVDGAMEPFDAVVAPSSKTAATPIDQEFLKVAWWNRVKDPMGAVGNAAGLPSISVPSGFTNDGLPVGIQFMGRAYDENIIIAIAAAFQSLTDWHTRHPNMQGILNSSSPLSHD